MGRRGPEPLCHKMGSHLFVFVAILVFVHSRADVPACLAGPLKRADDFLEQLQQSLRRDKNVIGRGSYPRKKRAKQGTFA